MCFEESIIICNIYMTHVMNGEKFNTLYNKNFITLTNKDDMYNGVKYEEGLNFGNDSLLLDIRNNHNYVLYFIEKKYMGYWMKKYNNKYGDDMYYAWDVTIPPHTTVHIDTKNKVYYTDTLILNDRIPISNFICWTNKKKCLYYIKQYPYLIIYVKVVTPEMDKLAKDYHKRKSLEKTKTKKLDYMLKSTNTTVKDDIAISKNDNVNNVVGNTSDTSTNTSEKTNSMFNSISEHRYIIGGSVFIGVMLLLWRYMRN